MRDDTATPLDGPPAGGSAELLAHITALPGEPDTHGSASDDSAADESAARGQRQRRQLVSTLARRLKQGAERSARGAGRGGRSVTERLVEAAPRIPVRAGDTLRAQFPELDTEEIADRLQTAAIRSTTAVGAGVGAAAALPNPMSMPVELSAETLAVAAIEVKLVAELHELYGVQAAGHRTRRAEVYLRSWASRRGLRPSAEAASALVSTETKRELRGRLWARTLRNAPTVTPFLIGAAVGGVLNRRDTRTLAENMRRDLRQRAGRAC